MRAVELAPNLAEAHTSLGFVQLLTWDWTGAERSLDKAIELNARYSQAHNFRAWLLSTSGRQAEADKAAWLGRELDPFSPAANGISALVHYHGRRYEDAIKASERALERDATSALSLLCISMANAANGAHHKAILHAERGVTLSPEVNFLRGILGAVYAMAGDKDGARGVLRDLDDRSKTTYVAPLIVSWIYCHLGEPDNAFNWLTRAYNERACSLSFGLRAPLYDVIREDSRFAELSAKLRLT
jgi:tetratricopeptide (TPR) repeat protein